MIQYTFVIPSFNKSGNLNNLCNKLLGLLKKNNDLEIVLVNNGSTDQTLQVLNQHSINRFKNFRILNIKENIGYGYGILSGLKFSKGKIIAWFHADMQTDPNEVFRAMITNKKKLLENNCIVKGKRLNRFFFDNLFTKLMSIFVNLIFKISINDINAQPKIFNKLIYKKFVNPPYDFSLDLYFLLIVYSDKYKIIEYPIYWNKRQHGKSKGGDSLLGKVKLTYRSIKYIINLRRRWKL